MKRKDLARRAASAAMAACMMFTLSAPALAESTDALMQLSIGSYHSSSLLSEENSFPTIKVNGTLVNEANIGSILGSQNAGKLSYDATTKTLKSNGSIMGNLTIDAPGVNIVLDNPNNPVIYGKLTVTNAASVKATSKYNLAVVGAVEISCDGEVEITSGESYAVTDNVTVKQASKVAISGKSNGNIVTYDVKIECHAPVTIRNNGTGGMARSINYSGGKYVYSTTENGTRVDPATDPIKKHLTSGYLRITPVTAHAITVTNGTSKVGGADVSTAYADQTVTVTPDDRTAEGYQFVRWEVVSGIADAELIRSTTDNTATFTMPDKDVELKARYNKLYTITAEKGIASLPQAIQGTEVTITANTIPGRKFDHWEVKNDNVTLKDPKSPVTTFKMLEDNVTVEAKYKAIQPITVNGGTYTVNGTAAAEAVKGDKIVATADPAPAGQKFSHWEVTGVDGLTKEQLENVPLEFTMPRGEVTLKAVFKTLHKIDVKFSTADKDTAIEGETVKITAESRPGYVFDHWEVNNGDVAVAKKNEEETTFVMPDKPVTAVAKYKKLLGITVNSGKAYVEDAVTDAALKGKPVVIKADKIEGKRFDQWKIVSGNVILDNQRAPEARFTMPETAVEITALYNDLHAITVNNGTADVEKAVIGDTVKIKAESREGYVFDRWEVSYGDVAVANKNAEETTFVMPDSMVVLTARYKAMQSITLENGKAYAGGEEITTAKKGTEVAIMADDLDGKVFDRWEIVSGNVTLENANKAKTTFTMPAESISLKAVYNTIHSIHTTFCTADPASAIVGTEITVTADERPGYVFDRWEASDGVELTEDGKFTMPDHDVTIEAKYKQYHSIEVSKGMATDAEGNPISSALEGTEIWIEIDREQRNPDEFEFKHWESGPEDLEIANRKAERTSFTMPDEDVTVEAKFLHLREITVHDGTTYVEGEEGGIAKAGQTVTVKADEIPGLKFDHWTVDSGNVTLTTVDEATGEATFEMVNEPVELTAHYKAMVTVFSVPAKFSEDTGEESVTEWADVGEMANIIAEIDEATFPGMVFDYWEIVTPADLKAENIEGQTIEFKVPKSEVKLVAHWKSDALNPSTDPDAPLDPDFDVDPVDDGSGAAGAIVAGAALGGAAVWGGYEITTRVILNDLLPEGAAIPANRGQLALLIWTEKGKPEPAAQPAFADITDAEQAKAAQWCVEQGLLDAREGKFESDGWMPKFKTIEIWNKAFPKK